MPNHRFAQRAVICFLLLLTREVLAEQHDKNQIEAAVPEAVQTQRDKVRKSFQDAINLSALARVQRKEKPRQGRPYLSWSEIEKLSTMSLDELFGLAKRYRSFQPFLLLKEFDLRKESALPLLLKHLILGGAAQQDTARSLLRELAWPEAIGQLTQRARHPRPNEASQIHVIRTLGEMPALPAETIDMLKGLTQQSDSEPVRRAAKKALAHPEPIESAVSSWHAGNLDLTQARAVPYFRNGKMVGVRFFAIRRGSDLDRAGLRNGDILLEIDGQPVEGRNAMDVLQMIAAKNPAGSVLLKIERAGNSLTLTTTGSASTGSGGKSSNTPSKERSGSSAKLEGSGEQINCMISQSDVLKAAENLPLTLTLMRAVPYFKDGKVIGVRAFAIKRGGVFEKMKIKNGDIFREIDGVPVGDAGNVIWQILAPLRENGSVEIHLSRNRVLRKLVCKVEK